MNMKTAKKSSGAKAREEKNPIYVKIGKRIRQLRQMAGETNSRELSLRLGWSAGRINNFELGLSTPGPEETIQLCQVLNGEPAWVTYGIGSPRPTAQVSTRYCNFMAAVEEIEEQAGLPDFLDALKTSPDRLDTLRANPLKKIPDVMARRCEKYLDKPRGWLDEKSVEATYCEPLPQEMRDLLQIYIKMSEPDQRKFHKMGLVMLGVDTISLNN